MENRRTPNHLKPPGLQKSNSKFVKPRTVRKQDANVTLSNFRSPNMSVMGSTRSLNETMRPNLDTTHIGSGHPSVKSSFGPPVNDQEVVYDLVYNGYLQALLKQQIVKNTIQEYGLILNDQILIQTEYLHKLENRLKDIIDKIDSLREQSDIVDLLEMLKLSINEIEELCLRYNTHSRLADLNNILTRESNIVSIKHIKPINSQEEYDKLISVLVNLRNTMRKIVNEDKNFNQVNELAKSIKEFKVLNDNIMETVLNLISSNKKAAAVALKQASDFFAQQAGYF